MLTLLLNPTIRKVLLVFGATLAVLLAYGVWSAHLRSVGAAAEKAREAAIASQHEQEVTAKATAVDQAVSQDANPQDTLRKEWSK